MSECIYHEGETIDLTPDADGYAAIGAMFVASVTSDFTKARRVDATHILASIIDLAFSFGYAAGTVGDVPRGEELRDKLFSRIGGRPVS
jgi:hypothetical protein